MPRSHNVADSVPVEALGELDDDDRLALVDLVKEAIERDPIRVGPRINRHRRILAWLAPPPPKPEPYPPPRPTAEPSLVLRRKRAPRRRR